MRIFAMVFAALLSSAGSGALAAGEVIEPHALLYIQVPFSGDGVAARPGFGFRVDQVVVEKGRPPRYAELLARPALLDLRMGESGLHSLTIAGTDYLESSGVNRAEEKGDEEKSLKDIIENVPVGVWIGAAIGVIIFTGVAD